MAVHFSFVPCNLKMPSCSAPCCKNRSEIDNIPVKRFLPKKLVNVYVCRDHFTNKSFEKEYLH